MKKILLATSILAATSGFAAAEVTVSGETRMGLVYDGNDTRFSSRIRVSFDMSAESDSGLSFGASIRADQAGTGEDGADGVGDAFGGNDMDGGSVWISGGFGKLTFGDNDSAANVLVGNVSGVGFTGLGDENELGYLGQTDTSALYEYTTGAISFALSSSQIDAADEAVSVAVRYTAETFSVALGYEDTAADKQLTLGGSATMGAATVKAVIADRDLAADTAFALSVDYAMDATTITAFYADHGAVDAFGLGVSYDLGGGAALKAGVVDNGVDTVADLGVTMSF